MKKLICTSLVCLSFSGLAFGYDNPVEGGTTQVVTNSWNVPLPWMRVGSNTSSNQMLVSGNGQVNNQIGTIGANASSAGNSVEVSGRGASWNNGMDLSVGDLGAGNWLSVRDGGMVQASDVYIGNQSAGNQVEVAGNGSLLDTDTLLVGRMGSSNQLSVLEGGLVETDNASIGHWIGADGNTASISGPDSAWTNAGSFNVGEYGSGNRLDVQDGGRVVTPVLNVGAESLSLSNLVSVSGVNAVLDAAELNISGNGNRAEVQNGGTINTRDISIQSGGNLDLNDGGKLAVDNDFDASMAGFNFNEGGTLELSGELSGMHSSIENRRTIILNGTNAQWSVPSVHLAVGDYSSDNHLQVLGGGTVSNENLYIGGSIPPGLVAERNSVVVSGSGSAIHNSGDLYVGYFGSGNEMIISSNGVVSSEVGYIGHENVSSSNAVVVSGVGSLWQNRKALYIGGHRTADGNWVEGGAGNSLTVDALSSSYKGARVTVGDFDADYLQNNVITGGGILVGSTNGQAELVVGNGRVRNDLALSIGGVDRSGSVVVTGKNAVWDNHNNVIYVGDRSSDNTLLVNDGGTLHASDILLGMKNHTIIVNDGKISENNQLVIDGDGSSVYADVRVGYYGAGNTMKILNGGSLYGDGIIGYWPWASNNTAVVRGEGSKWESGKFSFGGGNQGNQIRVEQGGLLQTDTGDITCYDDAERTAGNSVVVTGDGSRLEARDRISLYGEGAELLVESNALVTVGTIDPAMLDGRSGLIIGDSGLVKIEVGADVFSENGYLGFAGGDVSTVLIDGSDYNGGNNSSFPPQLRETVWDAGNELHVGLYGSGSVLDIKNYGRVNSGSGYIGYVESAFGNQVLISGSNSAWAVNSAYSAYLSPDLPPIPGFTNDYANPISGYEPVGNGGDPFGNGGDLFIGYAGADNTLAVTDGAAVFSEKGYIGYEESAHGNQVLLSHGLWYVEDELVVGQEGSDNLLHADDGSWVLSTGLVIGAGTNASGNQVLLSGEGTWLDSTWNAVGSFGFDSGIPVPASNSIPAVSWMAPDYSTYVGKEGSYNYLSIDSGARMGSTDVCIGNGVDAFDNGAYISGTGSVWTNYGSMYVGHSGKLNSLVILDGAEVLTSHGAVIGGSQGADNNSVVVAGDDARWELAVNPPDLTSSGLNTNYYRKSVPVDDEIVYIDRSAFPHLNNAVVIGYMGSDNALSITDGGAVVGADAYLGLDRLSSRNTALVSGYNSIWSNSGDLYVGYDGAENSLLIEDGGQVKAGCLIAGENADADNNSVIVSGYRSVLDVDPFTDVAFWVDPPTIEPPKTTFNTSAAEFQASSVWYQTVPETNRWVVDPDAIYVGITPYPYPDFGSGGDSYYTGGDITVIGGVGASLTNFPGIIQPGEIGAITNFPIVMPPTYIFPDIIYPGIFDPSAGELVIGGNGSNNTLLIEDGAHVLSRWGTIGQYSNGWNNAVTVTGNRSEWLVGQDLSLGGYMKRDEMSNTPGTAYYIWADGGRGNALFVEDGGSVHVGGNLRNRNYSTISMDSDSSVHVGENYYQDASSVLRIGIETNALGAPVSSQLTVGGTAEFEAGAKIDYAYNLTDLQLDHFYTNRLVEAEQLVVGGSSNVNALGLMQLDVSGSLVDVLLWEQNQDIYALAGRKWLADSAGFGSNSVLRAIANRVDELSLMGNESAVGLINLLNLATGSQQADLMTQEFTVGQATYLHGNSMSEGLGEVHKRSSRSAVKMEQPAGAAGPHNKDQGLQGWAKPYGAWAEYDADGGFSGYDHTVFGTVVGLDRSFGALLLGVAGGYGQSDIQQDDGDSSKAKTGYGLVYVNWGTDHWFSQFNAGYGMSRIDDESGTATGNSASYDADHFSSYLGGGYEFRSSKDRILLTPLLSALWSHYAQDGYTDDLDRLVSAYDHDSLLGSLGGSLAYRKKYENSTLTPEARLFWLHEFNSDAGNVDYALADGSRFHFALPDAEENVLEAGLGLSWLFREEFELVFDVDGRFGEDYSAYAVSGRAVLEF